MHRSQSERRFQPRIKTSLRAQTSTGIRADACDISESGVGLSSVEAITSPTVTLAIKWPGTRAVTTIDARLVWKRDIEDTGSVYGMEFVGLDETQKSGLRQQLIRMQVAQLLEEIKDTEVKNEVAGFFLHDIQEYVGGVVRLNIRMHQSPGYSLALQDELDHIQTQVLLRGYCLGELLDDKDIIQKVKHHFRALVGAWAYKSPIVRYGFEQPRGSCPDYKMLEMLYDNKPVSKDPVGVYFDNDFLNNPYSVALRSRKDRIKEYVRQSINERAGRPCLVFSLGCGSCRELRELLSDAYKPQAPVTFTCLDADAEALRFSHTSLLSVASDTGAHCEFRFVSQDPVDISKNDSLIQSFGKQHLVYSLGTLDYLSDANVKKIIPYAYELLAPGAKLIITHKNSEKTFPAVSPDWFCDWRFFSRTKDDVLALVYQCGIAKFALTVETDDFNYVMYFIITRLA